MAEPQTIDDRSSKTPSNRSFIIVLLATSILVFTPVVYYASRGEPDRWTAAQAMEQYLDGDRAAAKERLQQLVDKYPHHRPYRLTLANWLLDDQQAPRALELIEPLYKDAPADPQLRELYQSCLIAVGRTNEALEIYKDAHREETPRGLDRLLQHKNELAYMRALASEEIDGALEDITQVTSELENLWNRQFSLKLPIRTQAAFCTARIYQYYYQNIGQSAKVNGEIDIYEKAIGHLDWQVNRRSRVYREMLNLNSTAISQLMATEFPFSDQSDRFLTGMRGQLDNAARELSVFLTMRSLMYQLNDQLQDSFRDRMVVEDLGFDPEEIAKSFPSVDQCGNRLQTLAAILDTRGCVLFEKGEFNGALDDLNAAIAGQEAIWITGSELPMANVEMTTDPRQRREYFERLPKKTLAVLLFHRSWVHRALGHSTAAGRDVARIRQLGYVPGKQLF